MSTEILAAGGLALVLLLVVVVMAMLNRRSVAYREHAASQAFSAPLGGFFAGEQESAPQEGADLPQGVTEPAWLSPGSSDNGSRFSELRPLLVQEEAAPGPDSGKPLADGEVDPAPTGQDLPVPSVASASSSSAPTYGAALSQQADPVAALVGSLLEGQGELSQTELRRLELFRPERVLEAAGELSPTLAGRGRESKRARLQKIRLHAETLKSAQEPEPGSAPEPDGPLEPEPAELHSAQEASYDEVEHAQAWPQPAAEANSGEAAPPDADPEEAETAALQVGTTSEPQDESWNPEAYSAASAEGWLSAPPLPDDSGHEYEALEVIEAEVPVVEVPLPLEESPSANGDESPVDFERRLGALDVSLEAAEDVLALPARERCDAIAFLDTPEIMRLLSLSDDTELKRAAVDQLERIATPESLNALNSILEEGEPDLQLYAVNAAERLLARM